MTRAHQTDSPAFTATPRRIQRRRTRGWTALLDAEGRKPIYVGRGTRWGNPWAIVATKSPKGWAVEWTGPREVPAPVGTYWVRCAYEVTARQVATEFYAEWIRTRPDLLAAARRELAGRNLMCWCPMPGAGEPDRCHAAVLLRLANQPAPIPEDT